MAEILPEGRQEAGRRRGAALGLAPRSEKLRAWTPKPGKLISSKLQKQPQGLLFYILLGSR